MQCVLTLACETGLRPADLVRLTRGNLEICDGMDRFRVRTQKRGRVAHIPVTPELRRLIDETPPDQLVLLVNDRAKPLNANSASRGIARYRDRIKDKLSDPSLRLQDTRDGSHTASARGPGPQANSKSYWLVAPLRSRRDRALCRRFTC
ncbi:hypothetical protein [Fontisubflavum oceani]|uniref:hypothetical protein n=1 Tax=Fontisubflavum oceani TaxID=2978973 RepID=UPI0038B33D60